jgi:hypothetical protein
MFSHSRNRISFPGLLLCALASTLTESTACAPRGMSRTNTNAEEEASRKITNGDMAPDFTLKDQNGRSSPSVSFEARTW